jgi:hypothetical protein
MKKPEFKKYVCDGDGISWMVDGFDIVARVERDDDASSPDKRQDGFWPSLDPENPGYIGPRSRKTLAKHMKRAHQIMEAWDKDEWWYVGVCVNVSFDDVKLTGKYDHALWGIEANYPVRGKRNPNAYLGEVARDLAVDALAAARAKLDKLKEKAA